MGKKLINARSCVTRCEFDPVIRHPQFQLGTKHFNGHACVASHGR